MIEADYFGTAGRHLYFQTDSNRFAGDLVINNGNLTRLNSSFGSVIYGQSAGIENGEVGSLAFSKIFTHGWSLHVVYNFGKSRLDSRPIWVKARRSGSSVQALLIPVDEATFD